jgi:site-specific DNA-methyltransferase (adenine-specific)
MVNLNKLMIERVEKIKEEINKLTKYRKEHADTFGEVFTDFYLIEEHVSNIDPELFKDPESTFLDPCAGFGSYPIVLIDKLMIGLKEWEPDPEKRWKHILENQIFMVEIQNESCEIIEKLFNPSGEYKLNLFNESFFDFN